MSAQSGDDLAPVYPVSVTPQGLPMFPEGAYRANLYVYDPSGRIDWYALVPASFAAGRYFTLGRDPACNIALNDGSVSTRHAYIGAVGEDLVFTDLESTNGSSLNGEAVREAVLRHGDVLRLGGTEVRFLYSYRRSPVQLSLHFVSGPNAGKTVAASGASTSIGRLNCAVNLQGAEVAPQHVRVDAFGRELIYVVNLNRERPSGLNGGEFNGIIAAHDGDRVQVGTHEFVLRVGDHDRQSAETLDAPAAPVARLSTADLAQLEAHLQDLGGDKTAMDLRGPVALFASPTQPAPAESSGAPTTGPAPQRLEPMALRLTDEMPPGERPPTTRRRGGPPKALVGLAALVGLVFGGALVPVPRTLELRGTLTAAREAEVSAGVRGRVTHLYFRAGETVVAGDTLAHLVDLEVQARLDQLDAQVAVVRGRTAGTVQVVRASVPAKFLAAQRAAEAAQVAARAKAAGLLEAFDRREVDYVTLERARAAVAEAEAAEVQARAAVQSRRHRTRQIRKGPEAEDLAALAEALRQRAELSGRRQVTVRAPHRGVLMEASEPVRVGAAVRAEQVLFRVVDSSHLTLRVSVPPEDLGAVMEAESVSLIPEGFESRRFEVELAPVAPAPGADGAFPSTTVLDNADARLRPGQTVRVQVRRPSVSALRWMWAHLAG